MSALSNCEFSYSFAGSQWMRNLAGGFLMGFGTMLVPGGNAALSLHAVTAYVSMIIGIALVMLILKKLAGKSMTVNCRGDVCKIAK